jgi:hypothetical protein
MTTLIPQTGESPVTQPGYRHRIIIMDRSGSIADILAGQQGGLREFFASEEKVPGKATFSLWDFDTEIRCRASLASLDTVRSYLIEPRGMTAMHDAVGDAVSAEGEKLAGLPEDQRPEDVTVIIASDGLENASKRRTGPEVAALLSHQQDAYGWRVIYMGTNQDAFAEGAKIGARESSSVHYANSDAGSRNAWAASAAMLSRAPVAVASAGGYDFSEDERNLAGSED